MGEGVTSKGSATMQDDPEAIAAKLTKAQREALLQAEMDGNLGRYFSRFISVPAGRGLVKARLGTPVWSGVMLSELGLRVRKSLQNNPRT